MSFVAPFFLVGLAALLVPIIIHMWSKDAKQQVAFGSLRFLRETETRTTRSIMPSQWLLLLLRLLLFTLIVLLLAGLKWKQKAEPANRMYFVDQVYKGSELLKKLRDTVPESTEVRWLAKGFPLVEEELGESMDYWQLLKELPSDKAACLVVISPLYQKDFVGVKESLAPVCQWVKPPVDPISEEVREVSKADKYYQLVAKYDEWTTDFSYELVEAGDPITIRYLLKVDQGFEEVGKVFQAALQAIQKVSFVTLEQVSIGEKPDWIIWLSDEESPSNVPLVTATDVLGLGQVADNQVLVNNYLNIKQAIKMGLPRKLLAAFAANRFSTETKDLRTMDENLFEYKTSEDELRYINADLSNYLWVCILGLIVLERWLSFKSNQTAS